MSYRRGRVLSIEPLVRLARSSVWPRDEREAKWGDSARLAEYLGVPKGTASRWISDGVSERQADRAATLAGLHPAEVWGGEWYSSPDELEESVNA